MKLYLAGAMTGHPEHNFPLFDSTAEQLRKEGHEIFNPADLTRDRFGSYANFMKMSLEEQQDAVRWLLAKELSWICLHADGVALLPNWETSRGARAEKATAEAVGLRVIYIDMSSDVELT